GGGGGVERGARRGGVVVPEDRVRDEAVAAPAAQHGAQLLARAADVVAAPGDRVEARVPVPLVAVARRGRAGERVRRAVAALALTPVGVEHARGERVEVLARRGRRR